MKSIVTILLSLLSLGCFAQHHLAIGASTNGLGISYRSSVNSSTDLGISANYFRVSGNTKNIILDNIVKSDYNAISTLLEGFLQWKPFSGSSNKKEEIKEEDNIVKRGKERSNSNFKESFFVKTGLAVRFNPRFNTSSTFHDKTLIGSFELTPDQVGYVNMRIATNIIQPMASLGYILFNNNNFFMQAEAGGYYHGKPIVNIESTGTLRMNDVNQTAIQNFASKYIFYPLLKIETGIKL